MITEEILKACRMAFEEYIKTLAVEYPDNHHKFQDIRAHSLQVVSNSILLANAVLPAEEDKRLAVIIALFHDIGKTSMIAKNLEASVILRDHATVSSKIIQQMDFFASLSADIQSVILKSVEGHSKLKLPKLDTEQQTLFARLLRDADKLDIYDSAWRFFKEKNGIAPLMTAELTNSTEISEKVLKSIQSGKTALVEDLKSMNDYKLLLISMAFDINFKYTFRIMSEKQYIQKFYEILPKRDQIIDAYRGIKLFVENKFVS